MKSELYHLSESDDEMRGLRLVVRACPVGPVFDQLYTCVWWCEHDEMRDDHFSVSL